MSLITPPPIPHTPIRHPWYIFVCLRSSPWLFSIKIFYPSLVHPLPHFCIQLHLPLLNLRPVNLGVWSHFSYLPRQYIHLPFIPLCPLFLLGLSVTAFFTSRGFFLIAFWKLANHFFRYCVSLLHHLTLSSKNVYLRSPVAASLFLYTAATFCTLFCFLIFLFSSLVAPWSVSHLSFQRPKVKQTPNCIHIPHLNFEMLFNSCLQKFSYTILLPLLVNNVHLFTDTQLSIPAHPLYPVYTIFE